MWSNLGIRRGIKFIRNKLSGNKILLRKKGGSYIMDVSFGEKGEEWIEIIVGSVAEESVLPICMGKSVWD